MILLPLEVVNLNRPNAIWLWDNSESQYVDLTNNVNADTDFNFLSDADDKIYIGDFRRFTGLYADLTSAGNYTSLSYSYSGNENAWKSLQLIDNYQFSESKYQRWTLSMNDWVKINFTETTPHPATPVDTIERYWVRLSASSVVSAATIDKLRIFPFISYTTPDKVSDFLQVKHNFDYSTIPTDLAVEDLIRRAEDYIIYRTRKSWRTEAVTEETDPILIDHNRYGFYPRHRDFSKVYSVQMWNGNAWQTLTEGRTGDYFINYNLGMIYITRLFLLPAMYGMSGRYLLWGYGEYKNSIKLDYLWGRNPETDVEFYIAEDIATKLAARDILQHADFSKLIVSGVDKVPYSDKVRLLTEDVETKLDSLCGVILY